MMEEIDLAQLRRAYTRSMPPTLRSVKTLEASFTDVTQQWHAFLTKERSHLCGALAAFPESQLSPDDDDSASLINVADSPLREALRERATLSLSTLTRLSEQLKAVKQELIAQLSLARSRASAARQVEADDGAAWRGNSTAVFFVNCVSTPPTTSETPATGGTESLAPGGATPALDAEAHLITLCQRVWVWALFFALLLSDMELLSGTLSYAVGELFPALPVGDDCVCAEWRLFLGETSPATSVGTSASAKLDDTVVVHGCAVLYEAFVSESDARDSRAHERTLWQPWLRAAHAAATGDDDDAYVAFTRYVTCVARTVTEQDVSATRTLLFEAQQRAQPLPTVVHLLVRLLTETLVRPQWTALHTQNAFRPIPEMSPSSSAADTPPSPRHSTTPSWHLLCRHARMIGGGGCDTTSCEEASLVCHVLQLRSLERLCVPWPVPEVMLHNMIAV